MSLLLLFGEPGPTGLLNSRLDVEVLEAASSSVRDSRLDVEVLYSVFVDLLNSRLDTEVLFQNPAISNLVSRLSIEVLEGAVISKERWGSVKM